MLKRHGFAALAILMLAAAGLSGCVAYPAPGYGYAEGYSYSPGYYSYSPGYYAPGYAYAPYGYYGGTNLSLSFGDRWHHRHGW